MDLQFDASFAEDPGGITANAVGSPPFVTAEQFGISDVSVSQASVKPGEAVTVTVDYGSDFDMVATRFDIDTNHPDFCSFDQIGFSPGADLYLEVSSATTDTTEGGCWSVINNGTITETAEVAVPLSSGTDPVEVRLKGRSSETVYDSEEVEIQVDERSPVQPEPPEPPDDGGDGGDGDGGGSNPIDNLLDSLTLGTDNTAVPLVILVVILVALLYLTAI